MAWKLLKPEPYDPDAQDGDGDGIVQEGTAWERPAGARLLLRTGLEVARGESSLSRPAGLQIIGADGRTVPYVPSYEKPDITSPKTRSPLSDVGAPSLRELGLVQLRDSQGTLGSPLKDAGDIRERAVPEMGLPQISVMKDNELDEFLASRRNPLGVVSETPEALERRLRELRIAEGVKNQRDAAKEMKIPNRDWKDFSDLDTEQLMDLRKVLDGEIEKAEDADDTEKLKDLRKKYRALVDEGRIRMSELSRQRSAKRDAEVDALWNESFAEKYGDLGGLNNLDLRTLKDLHDEFTAKNFELQQQRSQAIDDAIQSGQSIADLPEDLRAEAGEQIASTIADQAQKRLAARQAALDNKLNAGLQGMTAEELNALLIEADSILRDSDKFVTAQNVGDMGDLRQNVLKSKEYLRRRLVHGEHKKTVPAAAENLSPALEGVVPRAVDVRRPVLTELDGVLPTPKEFGLNPDGSYKFATSAEAAEFVMNGGSLYEVPNEFWSDVLFINSSEAVDDPTRLFYRKKGTGGMSDTGIYVMRNPDGTLGNQGFVTKNATKADAVGELIGFNLAVSHGLNTEGAVWDGFNPNKDPSVYTTVILPHSFNVTPEGEIQMPQVGDYAPQLLDALEDKGAPQVLAHLLHNYMLGVTDRHAGNGKMMMVDDKLVIVPIDQAWAGQDVVEEDDFRDFAFYMGRFAMHPFIGSFFSQTGDGIPEGEKRDGYWKKLETVFDDMITRGEQVVAGGERGWRKMVPARDKDFAVSQQTIDNRIEDVFKIYQQRLEKMKRSREKLLDFMRTGIDPEPEPGRSWVFSDEGM